MAKPAAFEGTDPFADSDKQTPTQPPQTVHELQAAVEGVTVADRVDFMGEQYRIGDKIGLMPLMRFAHATVNATVDDLESLAAVYDMLRDCIHADEWERFERDATAKKAEGDDLLPIVQQTIAILTARPTKRPSDSSAGPSETSANSTGSSPSPDIPNGQVIERLYSVDDLMRQAGG